MRRILGAAVAAIVLAACSSGSAAVARRDTPSARRVFGPLLRRTEALGSVTTDTSLDAYPADGGQLRGTATTTIDFGTGRASGYVEIQPATAFEWWRQGDGVFLQGIAVDVGDLTTTISDPDPSWSPPRAGRADTFSLLALLRDARHLHHLPGGRYRFTLPMDRGDQALRNAMQLNAPNLGDTFAGLSGRYTRGTGTAFVAHRRIVRAEFVFHGRHALPSAAVTIGLSRLGRSRPDGPPGPLTARPGA